MRFLMPLIGVLLLVFFGMPDKVLYAKVGFEKWFPFFFIMFLIPFLLYKTLLDYKIRENIALGLAISSVFLVGPLFGVWSENLSEKELDKNGIIQKGVVIQKWYVDFNDADEWLYKAKFNVKNNIFYTFSYKDTNNSIHVGDTILIKYSSKNPENNKILE